MNQLGTSYLHSHYGNSMNANEMREWGPKIAESVEAIIKDGKFPILIYRGMSGVATATTIANNMTSTCGDDFAMMYVRKKNEKSHGQRVEYTKFFPKDREIVWIFCDDFISSGKTTLEVVKAISKYQNVVIPFDSIRYALVLEGARWEESHKVNGLKDALCNHSCYADTIMKRMRRNYNVFLRKQRKERAERQARIDAMQDCLLSSL